MLENPKQAILAQVNVIICSVMKRKEKKKRETLIHVEIGIAYLKLQPKLLKYQDLFSPSMILIYF